MTDDEIRAELKLPQPSKMAVEMGLGKGWLKSQPNHNGTHLAWWLSLEGEKAINERDFPGSEPIQFHHKPVAAGEV